MGPDGWSSFPTPPCYVLDQEISFHTVELCFDILFGPWWCVSGYYGCGVRVLDWLISADILMILYSILVSEVWLQMNTGKSKSTKITDPKVFFCWRLEKTPSMGWPWYMWWMCGNLQWFSPQSLVIQLTFHGTHRRPVTSIGSWMLWRAACEMNIPQGGKRCGNRWKHHKIRMESWVSTRRYTKCISFLFRCSFEGWFFVD